MRGRVMKVRTSITEPGVSIAWSWNLFSMKRPGSRRSFAATIARESREDHLSRVRFRDSGPWMAWLCHSKHHSTPRFAHSTRDQGLGVDFWPVPRWIRPGPDTPTQPHNPQQPFSSTPHNAYVYGRLPIRGSSHKHSAVLNTPSSP